MAQPTLALQHRSGAAPQVYRLPGASPQSLGDPIGGAVEGATGNNMKTFNRVIQFQGDVYAAVNGAVYKKDDPTSDAGPWSSDHSFTGFTVTGTTQHAILGPYQFTENGIEKLFVCWLTSTAGSFTWNASILDGSTGIWSDVGAQSSSTVSGDEAFGDQIIYRGVLYATLNSFNQILTFDPVAQSFGNIITAGSNLFGNSALGIFNDRLLCLAYNGVSTNTGLFEISGTFNLLADSGFAAGAVSGGAGGALFPSPDGSVLYGLAPVNGSGFRFLKFIDTAGTITYNTDLTAAVLPAGLQPGGGLGATSRAWVFFDQETTPGSVTIQIYISTDGSAGSTVTQYRFVDELTTLVQEDVGASAAWAFSNSMTGGGERIFTPGELHIEIVERLAVVGGEAVRFKAWGAAGADKNVDFRFNTENEVPLAQATLIGTPSVVSGAAPAPTRNVNVLEGVTADGTTIYQTTWDVSTDGLVSGQRAQLVPRVYV
jgi:hypothetical protein